jgi:8-oxo-dGTP diphosphatase
MIDRHRPMLASPDRRPGSRPCEHGRVVDRSRVAAVIVRSGRVLMVRERRRGATGRHDGPEYWVLPGGGVEPGETPEQAVAREVREEVGLACRAMRFVFDAIYPSGRTACYLVEVAADEEPRLGVDTELTCDCPRMLGLDWIPLPPTGSEDGAAAIPIILQSAPLEP